MYVASLADSGDVSRLRLVAARGPAPEAAGGRDAYADSLLVSSSTRQNGITQTTDLAPTVLAAAGVPAPAGFVGSPIRPVDGGDVIDRLERLEDLDEAATEVHPIVPWFFNGLVVAQVLLYGLAALVLRRGGGRRARRALPGGAGRWRRCAASRWCSRRCRRRRSWRTWCRGGAPVRRASR